MKNKLISTIFLISTSLSLVGCNNDGISEKKITIVTPGSKEEPETFTLAFLGKNPYVVYDSIENFYNDFIDQNSLKIEKKDNSYVFTNLRNQSAAVLDLSNDTMTFPSYALYKSQNNLPHNEIKTDISVMKSEVIDSESRFTPGKSFSICLKDYNLSPVKQNDKYYLPFDVLYLLSNNNRYQTLYYNGNDKAAKLNSENITKFKEVYVNEYPSSFYEYCYDIFTLRVDLLFGLTNYSRPQRYNQNQRATFNVEGARKTFEPYKSRIVNSKSVTEYDLAFSDMLTKELDDGGHTKIDSNSFAAIKDKIPEDFGWSKEALYIDEIFKNQKNLRKNAPKSECINDFVSVFDTDEDGHGDIGYVYLPEFTDEKEKVHCFQDVLKTANEAFNANAGDPEAKYIKDVVIDDAFNTGGDTTGEGALVSWICNGKAKQLLKDAREGSTSFVTCRYDINGDTEFSKADYLPENVNIYLMSDGSYSAASALVFDTHMYVSSEDYKTSNKQITFMGRPDLGGACSVTDNFVSPTGLVYRTSSEAVGIYWDDDKKTCDEIMPVTSGWEMNPEQMVDRTGYINPKIVANRKTK